MPRQRKTKKTKSKKIEGFKHKNREQRLAERPADQGTWIYQIKQADLSEKVDEVLYGDQA